MDNSIVYRINMTLVLLAAQTIDSYRCHAENHDNITHFLIIIHHEKLEDVNKTKDYFSMIIKRERQKRKGSKSAQKTIDNNRLQVESYTYHIKYQQHTINFLFK